MRVAFICQNSAPRLNQLFFFLFPNNSFDCIPVYLITRLSHHLVHIVAGWQITWKELGESATFLP